MMLTILADSETNWKYMAWSASWIHADDMNLKAWHCSNSEFVKDEILDFRVYHDLNMVLNWAVVERTTVNC